MSAPPNPPPYSGWGPSGYHHWHYRARRGGIGFRLFWFAAGGLATAVWMRHHDTPSGWNMHGCMRHRPREQLPAPQAQAEASGSGFSGNTTPGSWSWSWPERKEVVFRSAPPIAATTPAVAPAETGWEQEKEMIADMKKKAADTAVEFSEATLDTILSTVTALKAKLAEQKTNLDEENKRLRKELEEVKRVPPRLV